MFNRNFSLVFISRIKINSAASLPEAAWIGRQQSNFSLCFSCWGRFLFLPLDDFICFLLCHGSSAFLGLCYIRIFLPVEGFIHPEEFKAFFSVLFLLVRFFFFCWLIFLPLFFFVCLFFPLVLFYFIYLHCCSSSAFLGYCNIGIFVPAEGPLNPKHFPEVGPGGCSCFSSQWVLLEGARKKNPSPSRIHPNIPNLLPNST